MTRLAYDSTASSDIPVGVPIVCGYVDGIYAWSEQDWLRHRGSLLVGIAVSPFTDAGTVLDVETGDARPDQAPAWVAMRRRAGVDPTVYCNRANWPAIRQAFHAQGVPEPHYWVSTLDGTQNIAGAVAVQYAGQDLTGRHYDVSIVPGEWPGVDGPGPIPNPSPSTDFYSSGGDGMALLTTPGGRLDLIYVGTDGQVYHRWQNTKIDDLAGQVESWGGGPFAAHGLSAAYTDGGATFAVIAATPDGVLWRKEVAVSDGHLVNEWAPVGGNAVEEEIQIATGVAPHHHTVSGTAS